jgi:hypothetical protein
MSVIAAEPPFDLSRLWRGARLPVVLVVIGLALVTILAVIGRAPNSTTLDPRNTAPNGAHALSVLLDDRGITVSVAEELDQLRSARADTIFVTDPAAVSNQALDAIAATKATVLLVSPPPRALSALGVPASSDAVTAATVLAPRCALPAATTAGTVRVEGELYAVHGPATRCYPQGADAALLESTRSNGATTIVLGSGSTLTNAQLAAQGNAALALGLLNTPLVQWVPAGLHAGVVPKSQQGLFNLLPVRLLWATLALFIALAVLALWRGRRLGRPVVEPLPVVVRATETVEGWASLLHAARARGAAARSLRTAAVRRLSSTLRLGVDADPTSVAALVAERTATPAGDVTSVLYGGDPPDDAALVRLAQRLPSLEAELVHDTRPPPGGQP